MHPQNYSCRPGFFAGRRLPLLLALSLLLVGAAEVRAQNRDDHHDDEHEHHHDDDHEAAEEKTMLRDGAWALQFQINPNFTLSSFQGATVSAKKQLSDESAIRFGVTANASYRSDKEEEDGEEQPFSESKNRQATFLDAQYLWYAPLKNDITVYYGAGPRLGFDRRKTTRENDETDEQFSETRTFVSAGVLGTLGVEWFVRSNISLTTEYSTDLSYSRTTATSRREEPMEDDLERKQINNGVSLDAGGVLFGVSVYF